MRPSTIALILLAAAAASCGGGDPASPGGGGGGGGGTNTGLPTLSLAVGVLDYRYSPGSGTVKVGGTVTWTNRGTVSHTVTGTGVNSGQLIGASGGGAYGMPTGGGSYSLTFPTAGSYTYHCANHAQMTGTITVVN